MARGRVAIARARFHPGSQRRRRDHAEDAHRFRRVDGVGHCCGRLCPVAERQPARSAAQDVRRARHGGSVRKLEPDQRGADQRPLQGRLAERERRPVRHLDGRRQRQLPLAKQRAEQHERRVAIARARLQPGFQRRRDHGEERARVRRVDGVGQGCRRLSSCRRPAARSVRSSGCPARSSADGQFGAWKPIGAEQSGGSYKVVWKNGGRPKYVTGRSTADGNFLSQSAVCRRRRALRSKPSSQPSARISTATGRPAYRRRRSRASARPP